MKNATLVYGTHSVEALIKNQPQRIETILLLKSHSLLPLIQAKKINYELVHRDKLDQMTQTATHQGIVAIFHVTNYAEEDLPAIILQHQQPFILILDGVQDPHNLGACLRSADAAGVQAVIVPKDRAVGLTPVVIKTASGAAATVPLIQVTNLARTMRFLKENGIWIFGASEKADQPYYEANLKGAIALALGAEGEGLRRLTQEHCDVLINIPMVGSVSSLNVSVAAAILMFEVARNRFIHPHVR